LFSLAAASDKGMAAARRTIAAPAEVRRAASTFILIPGLKRDEIGLNRHRALALCLSVIFSENRRTLFRIML